jgi:hypothetical protein
LICRFSYGTLPEKDYSSLGFAYGMGDVTLNAGMVENNNLSSMDTGVSFRFSALLAVQFSKRAGQVSALFIWLCHSKQWRSRLTPSPDKTGWLFTAEILG